MTACQTTPEEFAVSTQTVEPGSRITWVGKETALVGPGKIKVGAKLPEALLVNAKMETAPVGSPGQVLLINTIPSVDTPVCDRQTHILGETKVLDPRVGRVTISLDLPYAQQRFAEEAKLTGVTFFSDYRTRQFTEASGLQIERNGLLARAVIVVDAGGIVRHLQVVPEIPQLPDMEAAFAVANGLVSR